MYWYAYVEHRLQSSECGSKCWVFLLNCQFTLGEFSLPWPLRLTLFNVLIRVSIAEIKQNQKFEWRNWSRIQGTWMPTFLIGGRVFRKVNLARNHLFLNYFIGGQDNGIQSQTWLGHLFLIYIFLDWAFFYEGVLFYFLSPNGYEKQCQWPHLSGCLSTRTSIHA